MLYQLGALEACAAVAGTPVRYVKPHGALYNTAAVDPGQAERDRRGGRAPTTSTLPLLGLPGSALADAAEAAGLPFVAEAFADRAYLPDGRLVPARAPGAVLADPDEVVARAADFVTAGRVPHHGRQQLAVAAARCACTATRRARSTSRGSPRARSTTPACALAPFAAMRLLPYGEHAVLVEPDEPSSRWRWPAPSRRLRTGHRGDRAGRAHAARPVRRPGASGPTAPVAARIRAGAAARSSRPPRGRPVVLPVRYDGAGPRRQLADELGMSAASWSRATRRASTPSRSAASRPGSRYLTGLDRPLHAPRLAEPRTTVPAGSVGIAGEFTGVYPRASPGGWRLLGRTDAHAVGPRPHSPGAARPRARAVRFRAT